MSARAPLPRADFLDAILARKHTEVRERRARTLASTLEALARDRPAAASLRAALSAADGPVRIIAEVKRASPSVGPIADVDPPALAVSYARAGAAAISVLTDGPGFGGSLEDLRSVRDAVRLPVLRKDFVVDDYQLLEARAHGADAVLLIAAALPGPSLRARLAAAERLGLEALVEVHDRPELDRAVDAGGAIVGINNRDLRTFVVDLTTSEALLPRIPSSMRAVTESGVRTAEDARRLRAAGARNLLVGEALVRAPDVRAFMTELGAGS